MSDPSKTKRPRRRRWPCECLWCGRIWYARGKQARKSKFCNHKHFGKYLNWQAMRANPDKNRERHVRRCPGCRVYRPLKHFLDAAGGQHDTCKECRGERKSEYAKMTFCYCVDCGRRTDGTRRCRKCHAAWLDRYQSESGEEVVGDAYDPLTL